MVNMITKQDMYLHSNEQTSFLPADKRLSFDSVPCQASAAWNTCQFLWTHPKKVKLQQKTHTKATNECNNKRLLQAQGWTRRNGNERDKIFGERGGNARRCFMRVGKYGNHFTIPTKIKKKYLKYIN